MKKIPVYLVLSFITAFNFSQAQTSTNLYYDANGTTAGIGGTGNWTTTGANWTTSSAGTAALISGAWTNSATWTNSNANNAILQGTTGTLSLSSGSIYANQIQVNTTGFTIQNSSTGTSSANRYFRTKNGIILADGVNLNISSGLTTNGAITGFEGVITGTNGTTGVNTNCSITITGATLNSDSSIRIALDTSATDIRVPVIIATTGNGYANIGVSSDSVTNSIYGSITVNSNSRLVLGNNNNGKTRRINVQGKLTTVNTDLLIGETGFLGTIVLYGANSIGGNVVVQSGSLGYGSITAFGNSTVILSNNATFGQQGDIGLTDIDRTLPNNISVLGDVTLGLGSYGNYLSGNINLNSAQRTFLIANSTLLSGSITNGSLIYTNSSSSRTMTFNGALSLTNLSILGRGSVSLNGQSSISNLVVSNTTSNSVILGSGPNTINSFTVNAGGLSAANLGNGTKNLTLTGVGATATFSNTAISGSLAAGLLTLGGSNNIVMATSGSTSIASSGAITLSGNSNVITLNGSVLASGVTYPLITGTSVDTNGLTGPVTLTGAGVNNAVNLTLNGAPVISGANTYTFRSTATALELQVDQNLVNNYSWSGGSTGNWNTDPANTVWTLGGSPAAFTSNGNAAIDSTTEGIALTVDAGGISAGYVNVTGGSGVTLGGGSLSTLGLVVTNTALTVNNAVTATNFSVTNSSVSGSGSISTLGGTTVQCDTDQSLSVAITGTGGVTKSGTGTLTVSGGSTYTGNLVVNSGALATSGSSAIPDNATLVLSNAATLNLGGNETVGALIAASGSTNNLGAYTLTLGGNNQSFTNTALTTGTGGLIKNGKGFMHMNQPLNKYSGGFTLNDGEVSFTSSGNAGADGVVTNSVFGTGTLTLNGGTIRSSSDTSGRTINNPVVLNGDVTFGSNSAAATITVGYDANKTTTLTKDVTITNIGSVTWEQPIVGSAFRLTKAGVTSTNSAGATNLITFRASNDIAGMTITGGTVGYKNRNAFGAGTLIVSDGVTLGQDGSINNAPLTMNDVTDRAVLNELRLNGNITFGLGGTANFWGGNIDFTGGNRTITLGNTTTLTGAITNGGQLILDNGSGSVTRTLSLYAANTYTGGTVVRTNAALAVGHDQALGNGDLTFTNTSGSGVSILRAATLSTNATQVRTLANNIKLASGMTVTLDSVSSAQDSAGTSITVAVDMILSGNISGAGGLTKSNNNTVTLSGQNTYSGATAVVNGKLQVVTNNIFATITTNTVAVTFSNTPANGTYAILPGALTGTYTLTNTTASSTQKVTLSTASPASVTVASKSSQTITGLASTDTKTYGATAYTLSVTKGASSSPLTFASDNTGVATVSSTGLVTIVGAGSTTIRVNQAGDDNYLAATEATQVLTVAKATPSISVAPTASAITSGQSLSSSTLSGGTGSVAGSFAWTSPSTAPSSTGSFSVTFTPTDSANYNTATTNVSVTVNSAGPTFDGAYSGKNLTDVAPNGLTYLMNYAFGGSDTTEPKLPVQDTADSTKLALVAYVRTGDTSLSVGGQAAASLDFSSPSSATYEVITPSDAPAGMEKRRYSVEASGDRQFLRLIVTKQ